MYESTVRAEKDSQAVYSSTAVSSRLPRYSSGREVISDNTLYNSNTRCECLLREFSGTTPPESKNNTRCESKAMRGPGDANFLFFLIRMYESTVRKEKNSQEVYSRTAVQLINQNTTTPLKAG